MLEKTHRLKMVSLDGLRGTHLRTAQSLQKTGTWPLCLRRPYLTVGEAAYLTQTSAFTIYQRIRDGRIDKRQLRGLTKTVVLGIEQFDLEEDEAIFVAGYRATHADPLPFAVPLSNDDREYWTVREIASGLLHLVDHQYLTKIHDLGLIPGAQVLNKDRRYGPYGFGHRVVLREPYRLANANGRADWLFTDELSTYRNERDQR